jgi:hypothetical protein
MSNINSNNVSPITNYANVSNLKTIPDITRFLSAFCQQIGTQFNNLLSTRLVSGAVSNTGTILSGITNAAFGVSFVSAGVYYIKFVSPFHARPSVLVSSESNGSVICYASGVTTTGFTVGANSNFQFSFLAIGGR